MLDVQVFVLNPLFTQHDDVSVLFSLDLQEEQVFFYLLIACKIVNSCYTLLWDLKMDWGLFDRNAGENTLLREEIVYPQKVRIYTGGYSQESCWQSQGFQIVKYLYSKHLQQWVEVLLMCLCSLFEQAYYYCAIVEDIILRFAWTIPLSLGVVTSNPNILDIFATVLAPLEVFR